MLGFLYGFFFVFMVVVQYKAIEGVAILKEIRDKK